MMMLSLCLGLSFQVNSLKDFERLLGKNGNSSWYSVKLDDFVLLILNNN